MFNSKGQKNMSYMVIGIYSIILIWIVIFKFSINISELAKIRSINLIPFYYETEVSFFMHAAEVIGNILIFVPIGVYVGILKPNWSNLRKVIPGLCISLSFEVSQYIFAIGVSDITDIIGNTLGGIIGVGILFLLKKKFKNSYINIINSIGLVGEIFGVLIIKIWVGGSGVLK